MSLLQVAVSKLFTNVQYTQNFDVSMPCFTLGLNIMVNNLLYGT